MKDKYRIPVVAFQLLRQNLLRKKNTSPANKRHFATTKPTPTQFVNFCSQTLLMRYDGSKDE